VGSASTAGLTTLGRGRRRRFGAPQLFRSFALFVVFCLLPTLRATRPLER
jgi:hypothetical protein